MASAGARAYSGDLGGSPQRGPGAATPEAESLLLLYVQGKRQICLLSHRFVDSTDQKKEKFDGKFTDYVKKIRGNSRLGGGRSPISPLPYGSAPASHCSY